MHKTPLYQEHLKANAKCVDFSGWEMPLHYGSQIDEHHVVRQHVGMFDVSHMTPVRFSGKGAQGFLRMLLANDVAKLTQPGQALYSCMLNEQGGVIDDLIVYFFGAEEYLIVFNAGHCERVLAWVTQQISDFECEMTIQTDQALIAVQGPEAENTVKQLWPRALKLEPFSADVQEGDIVLARTGYTGEDGYEIILPAKQAESTWQQLLTLGVKPCGLGSRDTLRLEAGMSLSGSDMDEKTTPLESNLAWTIALKDEDRAFIGRSAIEDQKATGKYPRMTGLIFEQPGVLRNGQLVYANGESVGVITSGSFSPTLGHAIALVRITQDLTDANVTVERRGAYLPVRLVNPPFVRFGKKVFKI